MPTHATRELTRALNHAQPLAAKLTHNRISLSLYNPNTSPTLPYNPYPIPTPPKARCVQPNHTSPRFEYRSVVPQLANLSMHFSSMNAEIFNTDDNDDAGRPAKAVKSLMDYFYRLRNPLNKNVSAVLGPTFSSVAEPTALIASAAQVPMLSYFASSPELSNNLRYPFFTRTYPTDGTAARILTRFLYDSSVFKDEDWNHVAVVYRDDAFGQGYLGAMQDEFDDWTKTSGRSTSPLPANFKTEDVDTYYTLRSFAFTEEEPESVKSALKLVKDSSYSIIVLVGASQSLATLLEANLAVHACCVWRRPCWPPSAPLSALGAPVRLCSPMQHVYLCVAGGKRTRLGYVKACVVYRGGHYCTENYRGEQAGVCRFLEPQTSPQTKLSSTTHARDAHH